MRIPSQKDQSFRFIEFKMEGAGFSERHQKIDRRERTTVEL